EVVIEAVQDDVAAFVQLYELERSCSDRLGREGFASLLNGSARDNYPRPVGHYSSQERSVWLRESQPDRVFVYRDDLLYVLERAVERSFRVRHLACQTEHRVISGEFAVAAMELDALPQVKGVLGLVF